MKHTQTTSCKRKLFILLIFIFLLPQISEAKQKICLNMIVKNECEIITRCLDSVKPVIDYWVIVDTGSTDGTQEIIKKHMKDIPGELHERPWINWGETRSEAFNLARGKGDYILFMDADDTLEFNREKHFPLLTQDLYNLWRGVEGFTYQKPQLVKGNLPWKWVGVTHEYLDCSHAYTSATLTGVKYISRDGGATRKDANKFWKNVQLLEEGLKKEPENIRYVFYLAESYRDAGETGKALEWFQKRIRMGGWAEEVYWSKLQAACILRELGLSLNVCAAAFLDAHHYRPHRSEAIYYLTEIYNQQENYTQAYECLKNFANIAKPAQKDSLFNMDWCEEYGLLFQMSICAYYVKQYQESLDACDKLLTIKNLPEQWLMLTQSNRQFSLEAKKIIGKEK